MGWRSRGGVSMTVMSRTPESDICRVRGMGVAERVSTSTCSLRRRSTSFWGTPKRCSSSTITRPRSLGFTSSESSRCVPMSTSTLPALKSLRMRRCSAAERKREIISTFTGKSANRSRKVP